MLYAVLTGFAIAFMLWAFANWLAMRLPVPPLLESLMKRLLSFFIALALLVCLSAPAHATWGVFGFRGPAFRAGFRAGQRNDFRNDAAFRAGFNAGNGYGVNGFRAGFSFGY